ncbi:hypothetical protein L861_23750 [Litchfieldella anticariensis FP35 = DSM 16096]|uniref:PBS lyase n=2 Tax=Litchfieldella anticariensis TaxID=258591 RepID=S2KQR2_LITA3|nr:hypothetical protein L861_23750 [Halomonas anticariensis FP35 = DSM 16096]
MLNGMKDQDMKTLDDWILDLESDDFDIMWTAILKLDELGDEKAIEPLTRVGLHYDDEDLWYNSWWAVKDILGIEAFFAHVKRLYETFSLRDSDAKLRRHCLSALTEFAHDAPHAFYKEVFTHDPDHQVKTYALYGLASIKAEENIRFLRRVHDEQGGDLKETAKQLLATLEPDEYDALSDLASDDPVVRRDACKKLAANPQKQAIPRLIELLEDRSEPAVVRFKAGEALGAAGDERAVEPMIRILRTHEDEESVRSTCARQLGHLGDERAVEPMAEYLLADFDEPGAHSEAAIGLGRLGSRLAIPALIKGADDRRERVRRWSLEALGKLENHGADEVLIRRLSDEERGVREYAALALARQKSHAAREPFLTILREPDAPLHDYSVRWRAVWGLGRILGPGDREEISVIAARLEDEHEFVRGSAIEALTKLKATEYLPRILGRLQDEQYSVKNHAIDAVGQLGDTNHIEILKQVPGKRKTVDLLTALVRLGDKRSLTTLLKRLDDPDDRPHAGCALVEMGDERGLTVAIEALQSKYWNVRLEAIRVLRDCNDEASLSALQAITNDPDESIRSAARKAVEARVSEMHA